MHRSRSGGVRLEFYYQMPDGLWIAHLTSALQSIPVPKTLITHSI
jgi:hypothetical protein